MAKSRLSQSAVLAFRDIFPDKIPPSKEELVLGIDRSRFLKYMGALSSLHPSKSRYKHPLELIQKRWFQSSNEVYAIDIRDRIIRHAKTNGISLDKLTIIYIPSSLKMLEFGFSVIPYDSETKTLEQIEIDLFQLYLIFNQEFVDAQDKATELIDASSVESSLYKAWLTGSMADSEIINLNQFFNFLAQLMKARYLIEFLENDEKTSYLYEEFKKQNNVDSGLEYIRMLAPVISLILKGLNNEKYNIFTLDPNKKRDKKAKIIFDQLSLVHSDIIGQAGVKQLMKTPLVKLSKNEYLIPYIPFFFNKFYNGIYFQFSDYLKDNKALFEKGDFRSHFTQEFSENKLVSLILREIHGNKYVQFSGEDLRDIPGQPDYYIRNGNKLLLFEAKDSYIADEVKYSYDYELIKQDIRKKFYYSENKNGNPSRKAVLQLINSISKLLSQEWQFDHGLKANNVHIFPVLIVHDFSMDTVGVQTLINLWFNDELKKLKEAGLDVGRVKPIVVVHIDTLVINSEFLKRRHFNLFESISGYLKHIQIPDGNRSEYHLLKSLEPFSSYYDFTRGQQNGRFSKDFEDWMKELLS